MQGKTKLDRLFDTCRDLSAKFYEKLKKYEKLDSNSDSWESKLEENYSSSKHEKVNIKKDTIIGWLNGTSELNKICLNKDSQYLIKRILEFASKPESKGKKYERKGYKNYAIIPIFLDNAKRNIDEQISRYKQKYRKKSNIGQQGLYAYDSFFHFLANTRTYDGAHSFKFLTKFEGMKKIQSKLEELSAKFDTENLKDNNKEKYGKDFIIAELKIILTLLNNELYTKLQKIGSNKGKIFTIMHMRDPLEKRIGSFPKKSLEELKSMIELFNKEFTRDKSNYDEITKTMKEINKNFNICKLCGPDKSVFESTTGLKAKDMNIIGTLHLCSNIRFYSDARIILEIVGKTGGKILLTKLGILPVAKSAYEGFEKS